MDNSTEFIYDEKDRLLEITSAKGASFEREYDEIGRPSKIKYPDGNFIKLNYEGKELKNIEDKDGRISHFTWDKQSNLKQIQSPTGATQIMDYDYLGRMIESTAPNGTTTNYQYDIVGNLTKVIQPDGNIHRFKYDESANVIEANDSTRKVEFTYWGLGHLKTRKENGKTIKFNYDTEEQLKSIQNEHKESYRFVRDAQGRIIGEWGFDGLNKQYVRNAAGQVVKSIRPEDRYTNYQYDKKGNITTVSYNDNGYELYTYDEDNQLIEASNPDYQVKLKRDKTGKIFEEVQNNYSIEHAYNSSGQHASTKSSLGAFIEKQYDKNGFLTKSTASQNGSKPWEASFGYDMMGLEIQREMSGGIKKAVKRDKLGRVSEMHIQNRNLEGSNRQYVWSAGDQLKSIIHSNGEIIDFAYDEVGNLAWGSYNQGVDKIYKCPDAVGNLYKDPKRKDQKYAASGKLIEDADYEYKYDVEGFLIQKIYKHEQRQYFSLLTDDEDTDLRAKWTYQWSSGGQLKRVISPNGKRINYEYDALGRRTAKIIQNKKINRYIYNGNALLHEWSYDMSEKPQLVVSPEGDIYYDKEEPIDKEFLTTWIFDNNSFAPSAKLVGSTQYSIITDYLGTPVEAYDIEGKKVWECQLDVYGKVHSYTGDKHFVPFRYQGQYEDEETGLYYNRFRYYSPDEGVYISQDPIGLDSKVYNFYTYVSDTNTIIDSYGLDYIYELVNSSGDVYYTGKAADNASMQSVAERHSKTIGNKDGARFSKGDKMVRKTETGLDKNTTRGLEQRGLEQRTNLGRQNDNVRGNKINSTSKSRKKTFKARSNAADDFLNGKKFKDLPNLEELSHKKFKSKKHH